MANYFSNILTATKTRYQSIRGDTDDGDTEDDSHLARCLRTYYQENDRAIPDWLGGGPPPVQSLRQTNRMPPPGQNRQGVNASLSDIWDNPQPQRFQQQPPGGPPRHPQQPSLFPGERKPSTPVQDGPGGAGKALTSAQQRIKERLWGGRTASPPPQGQFTPPPPPQSVQMPGEHMFGGGAPPPRRQGGGMPWEDSESFNGAPGVSGYYGGSSSGGGGNLRRLPQGGSGGKVGMPSGSGFLRGQRGGGY
ncbi:hypothetical protein DFP73DRAFT_302619 [Morchella snyderi]|nr:hypothetical protein DFP73DRAFT_302619 [Morchella snyderi]